MVYIGSDKPINKDEWQDEYMKIKDLKTDDVKIKEYFSYKNIYFISSFSGCSCEFRIAMAREMGFGQPVEWYPESEESIRGTKKIFRLVTHIVKKGGGVELLSIWWDQIGKTIETEDVNIIGLKEGDFRMFENRMFKFVSA